jgi:phosphatidylinositol glycan class B
VSLSRFHRFVFVAAALVYAITAWFSTGYHSADEHFQIIAFAQWKLGELPMEHLAWEFNAGIRSSFQPWIAVAVFNCADALGIGDPFTQTLLLRLLTAVLALVAVRGFVRGVCVELDQRTHKVYIVLSYLLWFLPFLHVRFSSEGWSGIALVFMVSAVLQRGSSWAIRAGIFAGIAILCRPPTGLIVLSAIAWILIIRKERLTDVFKYTAGTLLTLALGLLLDRAFYGHFTPTTWNYVGMGLTGSGAPVFDQLPWYYYPPWIVKYAIPPIGAIILLALLTLLVKRPQHLAVWCTVPYVVAHSFIPHKELRFLYPLADLVPWMVISAWSLVLDTSWTRTRRPLFLGIAGLLVIANLMGLAMVMTSSAGEGRVRIAEELHRSCKPGDRIGYAVEEPIAWRIMLPDFYRPPGTSEAVVPPHVPFVHAERLNNIVVQDGLPIPINDARFQLTPIVRTEPMWSTALMRWYTWSEGQKPWTLYRVRPVAR